MRTQLKKERTLSALLDAGMTGLRQIEVASPFSGYSSGRLFGTYWSSCLSSDMSKLVKEGVAIDRRLDPYTNQSGNKSNFKRYRLQDRNAARQALKLLNLYRKKRGRAPLSESLANELLAQFQEAGLGADEG
ncbi:hypothetical protein [Kistimonas asteriae]|uniref:hypothetical protein n=1 Tax=Kistimonas asteriae TaxID=517724 RepID=UPI001BA92D5A|nr:hypothetical protein [Kistimonas asteriae]